MKIMQISIKRKATTALSLVIFALGSFALLQKTQALNPPPDGGYPGGNTAEGQNALSGPTISAYNTAIGFYSLASLTDAGFNTGVGAGTLLANIAPQNTATGAGALFSNTTGPNNTAIGAFALFSNTEGVQNTATGSVALVNNIGSNNTANGFSALNFNFTGNQNTAVGYQALQSNTQGSINTALGANAGSDLTTGDNNIDIGANVNGVAGESNTIRIGNTDITATFVRGISGQTVASGAAVLVAANGHLGTVTSSARFKEQIKAMDKASEALFLLKPVTFRYKKELDPAGTQQFGLVAEEVEKVNLDLVVRDEHGKANTVRYDQVNAMLLNEFLKEHKKVEALECNFQATVEKQQKEIQALTSRLEQQAAQIQNVSDQIEINKAEPGMVRNDLQGAESSTSSR